MPHRSEPLAAAPGSGRGLARRGGWIALAAIAVGLAFWLGGRVAAPARPGVAGTLLAGEASPAQLQAALAAERAARERLALELAELRERTDALAARLDAEPPVAPPSAADAAEARERERTDAEAAAAAPRAPLFDVEALVAGCMDRGDAERLRARWERYELDRLQLNDRAMRESYFMHPRHRTEHAALDAAFRRDVGEDGYDAYLRATGKPNRVAVGEVLASGAGSAAGLEVGDELERYDGVRVFSSAELQQLTAAGRLGETVSLEVLRGGQPLTLRAARGPLGVVLEGAVRAPAGGANAPPGGCR
jgi:hypothetical protein